jgi:hypothetical protein
VPIPSVRAAPRLSLIDPLDPSAQLLPGWSSLAPTAGRDVRGERAAGRGAVAAVLAAQGGPTSPRLLECLRSPTLPRPGWLRCPARRRHRSALPRPAVVGVGDFLASLSSSFCTSPPRCCRRRGRPRFLVVIILHFPAPLSSASGTSSLPCRHHPALPRPAVVGVGDFLARSLSSSFFTSPPCCRQRWGLPQSLSSSSCTSPPCCRQRRGLPRFSASASYCAECHSLLLSATPSAPSPQSGFTDNEVWRGPFARRLSPWTGRTVLDAPTTRRSCRP